MLSYALQVPHVKEVTYFKVPCKSLYSLASSGLGNLMDLLEPGIRKCWFWFGGVGLFGTRLRGYQALSAGTLLCSHGRLESRLTTALLGSSRRWKQLPTGLLHTAPQRWAYLACFSCVKHDLLFFDSKTRL